MKILNHTVSIIERPNCEDYLKWIEKIGRICYKSENKITEISAKNFIKIILNKKHNSVLEHLYLYLHFYKEEKGKINKFKKIFNEFFSFIENKDHFVIIGNLRSFWEKCSFLYNDGDCIQLMNNISKNLFSLFEENNFNLNVSNNISFLNNEKKLFDIFNKESIIEELPETFHIITNRKVSHEIIRHRRSENIPNEEDFAISQESTRYCNYSKDKFNSEISFILPTWFENCDVSNPLYQIWYNSCIKNEEDYMKYIKINNSPQEASLLLNHSLKTEFYITKKIKWWRHFLNLRITNAYPEIMVVANYIHEELKKKYPNFKLEK